ncbi:Med4p [Sporobolomyces koalae]|uniref:Med4p n=1 Tax=Sporobolomyces koalae TaxID=500713 RepID=UPI00316F740C
MAVPSISSTTAATRSTTTLTATEIALIPSSSVPIGPQISYLLSEFASTSIQLFSTLSSPPPPPSAASTSWATDRTPTLSHLCAPIYARLSDIDHKLSVLVGLLAQHERRQAEINSLVSSLSTLSSSTRESTRTLHACVTQLEPIVESGKVDRASIARAAPAAGTGATISSETLLSYARLLAPFTSAPPASLYPAPERLDPKSLDPTGRSLPLGSIPPFPTEGVMRRGRLQFGREDQLGRTDEVGTTNPALASKDPGTIPPPTGTDSTSANLETRLQFEQKQFEQQQQQQQQSRSTNFASTISAGAGAAGGVSSNRGEADDEEDEDEEMEEFEFDLDLNPDM